MEVIEESDIVLEIIDCRFIKETRNTELEDVIKAKGKKLIYVLNKSDLVNKYQVATKLKLRPYIFTSSIKREGSAPLRDLIKAEAGRVDITKLKGKDKKIYVAVVGYPNTGKSSLINFLVGKRVSNVGNEAGFTKGKQKLKFTKDIMFLDTPGVIQESQYSMNENEKLAQQTIIGARSISKLREPELVVQKLVDKHRGVLEKHYDMQIEDDADIFLDIIAKKMGYLKKGGVADTDRAARFILTEWQNAKISEPQPEQEKYTPSE